MDHRDLKERYQHQKQELTKIINDWDPYSLLAGEFPEDEFSSEISEILAGLVTCRAEDDVAVLVSKIFSKAFEPEYFSVASCRGVAQTIWTTWRSKGWEAS